MVKLIGGTSDNQDSNETFSALTKLSTMEVSNQYSYHDDDRNEHHVISFKNGLVARITTPHPFDIDTDLKDIDLRNRTVAAGVLYFERGLTLRQIGKVLDITPSAVSYQILKYYKLVRAHLARINDDTLVHPRLATPTTLVSWRMIGYADQRCHRLYKFDPKKKQYV